MKPRRTALTEQADDYRARLEAALIAADIGTWLWDIASDCVRGDRNLDAMFGVASAIDVGLPIADYMEAMHLEDRTRVAEAISRAIATGGSDQYEEEYRLVVAGRERWVLARGIIKRDAQGAATELSGVVLDISRQKELESERRRLLEQSATQARIFDTTLSSIVDFAYIFDLSGRFRYVNKALLDLWGLTLEQAVGKNFHDLQYPEPLASKLQQQIQQVIDTRHSLSDETPYTSPTGVEGFYEYIFTPVLAEDGTVAVVAGSTRDVSARKRTESTLRSRTAQFETLFADAPLGVYLVDADFRVREVNPHARAMFANIPDVIGRDFAEVIHLLWPQLYADELEQRFRLTLETGAPCIMTERVEERLDLQQTQIYEWQINRIPLPDGRHGVACYFREVSTQVYARRALEAADRQKNEFLAMLAHELRNPLAPIRNAGELLARSVFDAGQVRGVAGVIRRQVGHLTRLVDDLLDVSRISQGRIDLQIQQLELGGIIAQAVETVGPIMREKQHNLVIVASPEPLYVAADPARLIQCVANILTNAAKYTDAGGQIRVESRSTDTHVAIHICDNGIGISEELLPHLFDLFVQGNRGLDRAQGGLGIGLAVVKRLIEMQAGTVTVVNSRVGMGTTFEIRLPRTTPHHKPDTKTAASATTGRRLMIVDDNTDAADSLAMLLTAMGHETLVMYSGKEALARIEHYRPEIVLLDIGLPGIDGYEVARRLRRLPAGRNFRLVALTGYGQANDRERARNAGFDEHLVKPVDLALLERVIAGESAAGLE